MVPQFTCIEVPKDSRQGHLLGEGLCSFQGLALKAIPGCAALKVCNGTDGDA